MFLKQLRLSLLTMCLSLSVHDVYAVPAQTPLFLTNPVVPIMMLNMSNDHQLFFKIYDDYSDIIDPNGGEPDGIPDTTFNHKYEYFGYFDSKKCYVYAGNRFEPAGASDTTSGNESYCTGQWSGNFLNWASMTRMDAVRKILYGGRRSTDSNTETVLERSFLPNDAHSFAKFYDGADIDRLTPFAIPELVTGTPASGITICNTTSATGYSQQATALAAAPLMRVVKGNYSLWASNERWQCRWDAASNGNNAAASGIVAYPTAPAATSTDKLGTGSAAGEYYVRVKVCVAGEEEENCQKYPSATYANKPTGLLQKYGETNQLNFGLITGTYGRNKSGGVLRKKVGNMLDEINTTTWGTFITPAGSGIIGTLNLLRLYGYSYNVGDAGSYTNAPPGDGCGYGLSSFADGRCANWGNPQSEIYYESLRYLAGKTATAGFGNGTTDTGYIGGLSESSWSPVLTNANECAPLSVLQFNASSNSYDVGSTGYINLANIGIADFTALNNLTDEVGSLELITNTARFVGRLTSAVLGSSPNGNQLCTAKTIDKLSNVSGTCPDSPRLDGGYSMVGLARHARKTGISTNVGVRKVRTYGVALAPALPKVEVPVPGSSTGQKVIIQPACRNHVNTPANPATNCAIVDFKIVSHRTNVTLSGLTGAASSLNGVVGTQGKLYVNWEDSEQGGDYDQDMWGVINYVVTSTKVMVQTQVLAQSTPNSMGFGYALTGTDGDGFNVHSGINNFIYGASCTAAAGNRCTCNTGTGATACGAGPEYAARMKVYNIAASSASFMESPLYYAAKWGGYDNDFATTNALNLDTAIKNRTPDDTYFFATDPRELASKLGTAFDAIANDVASASAVATNSSYLTQDSFVYQSEFNSQNWSGVLKSIEFNTNGSLSTVAADTISTETTMPTNGTGRSVYTYNGTSLVNLSWANLTAGQKAQLQLSGDPATIPTRAEMRVDWLLGNATYENLAGGLRSRVDGSGRRNILGDLINSSPIYVGAYDYRYSALPLGGASYRAHVTAKKAKAPKVFVGSNDGMLHVFNAATLRELYAYIPGIAFPKLVKITGVDYGKASNPHQYIVDGPIEAGDVYIGGSWRTIIVGTLGAGGRGIYALDITNDTPRVLFELNEANYPQLGYVMGVPQILLMANGRWAVVFGNGDSSGHNSHLFVVDIEAPLNPTYTKVIDSGTGTGLSAVELLTDSLGRAAIVYAGDLSGNMWRFDLSDVSASNWKKDYLLFTARDALNNIQPIYAAPTLGMNTPKDVVMVYFGTGKYYDSSDNVASTTPTHSLYAIADVGSTLSPVTRSSLLQKTMTTVYNATTPSLSTRVVQESNPAWTTQSGWYLDFTDTNGERITTTPLLLADKLVFPTLIPSANPCDYGGSSWLMEVVAVGDKYVGQHVLDDNTYREALILGELGFGVNADGEGKIMGVDSKSKSITEDAWVDPKSKGRQSWRQLR